MARTTAEKVKAVLMRDYDAARQPNLALMIEWANLLTTRVATCAAAKGQARTSDELAAIETLLAAHRYCMSDRTYAQRSTGKASGSFDGKTGMALEATMYGQDALTLDTSGCLRSFNAGKAARMDWLGRAPSEQTDYQDRD